MTEARVLTAASMHLLEGVEVPQDRAVSRVAPSVDELAAVEDQARRRTIVEVRAAVTRRMKGGVWLGEAGVLAILDALP